MIGPVPTIDEIATDEGRAAGLSLDVLEALAGRCLTAHARILARMIAARRENGAVLEEDRLLDVTEAAKHLSVTEDWLYRHARTLPFTVRAGRKVRFSSSGIARWIRERQAL
jgi:predicted DNA-binding transcriptional regulator AlpA